MKGPVEIFSNSIFPHKQIVLFANGFVESKIQHLRKIAPTITSATNTEKPKTIFQDKLAASERSHDENGIYMGPK